MDSSWEVVGNRDILDDIEGGGMNFTITEWYSMFNYDIYVIIGGGVYAYSGYTYYNDIYILIQYLVM